MSASALRLSALGCALPTTFLAALGVGAHAPGVVEFAAAVTFTAWVVLGARRLRRAPTPTLAELTLAACGAWVTATVALAGGMWGFGSPTPPPLAEDLRGPAWLMLALACAAFLALAFWPQLRKAGAWAMDVAPPRRPELRPAWSAGAWVVFGVGLLVHGAALVTHTSPLVQIDSAAHLHEPALLHHSTTPLHAPPIYSALVKLAAGGEDVAGRLWALIALQHAAVIALGLVVERTVRGAGARSPAGAVAGLLVVTCGHLSLFAQEVMTEIPSTALVVASLACVFAAAQDARPARWLVLGGLAAATATLTRQAMQGWVVAGALGVLFLRFPQRARAVSLYLAAAAVPIALMILHNGVFFGRYSLTASVGRNLHYRVAHGLPDLTDPDAPPGDPYERARELIWEARRAGWHDAYSAIHDELGWDDVQTEQAMKRFYVEQILRHPIPFARVTLRYCGELLRAREDVPLALRFHDQVVASDPAWRGLPPSASASARVGWLHAFQPTSSWPVLLLALISPLVTRGPGRALALACLASVAYFVVVTSLVEWPVPRYRIPAIPFLAIACGLSVGGLVRRVAPRPLEVPS